ncbi:hypothetical protein MYX82_03865 [Acidobacteria bacterium AH-259-D05]|nr:hypothetical protein [Acidobacteria bacterium AH-259-D05]
MAVKLVLAPYEDPVKGLDWQEQTPMVKQRLETKLDSHPEGPIEYVLKETDHGIGADWPTITIEFLKWGGLLFSIPAAHRLIRETIQEWKEIKKTLDKIIAWIQEDEQIVSYSIEFAFLKALEFLESRGDVSQLELVNYFQIAGGETIDNRSHFESAPILYYGFVLQDKNSEAHVLLYSSRLEKIAHHRLTLDPRDLL